jgi:hypothetical protein
MGWYSPRHIPKFVTQLKPTGAPPARSLPPLPSTELPDPRPGRGATLMQLLAARS